MVNWLTEKWQIESMKSYSFYVIKYVPYRKRFRTKYVCCSHWQLCVYYATEFVDELRHWQLKKNSALLNKSRHALPSFANSVSAFESPNIHYYEFGLKRFLWRIFSSFDHRATAWLLAVVTVTSTDVSFDFRISLISKPPSIRLLYW